MSFSLIRNIKKIFSYKKQQDKLECIHGLKVYSMALIIMGHRIMFFIGVPSINTNYAESFYNNVETMVLLNGPIIVDTFFSISGFLAAYLILQKRDEKSKNSNFIFLYIHRLIRLTPVYALIVAFYCTIFVKLGNGPLWEERIGVEQERCISSWWANLLYLNNYINTDKICMFQSWYITCDMHLFLLTPFIVWVLRKSTKIGFVLLGCLISMSILSTFLTTFFGKLDGILLLYINTLKDPTVDQTFKNIYIPTHTRASPYLVGIGTGYLLHRIQKSDYKLSKRVVYIGWFICILTMEAIVYSAYIFYIPSRPYDPHTAAVYSAFHHFFWSICISWFILAISTGHGTLIDPLLSWRPLNSLSKITYTAFLCHGGIQLYTAASLRTPMTCGVFNLIWYSLGDIALTFTGALVLTTFFESPVIGLEKLLLGSNTKKREPWQKNVELKIDSKTANDDVTPISFIHVNSV
ncbi:nose resistant to fluoxetine protein 6-like [Agrilus planipennis]|uniref:Nose resistant to fluoxetine protein 6-like n=1 Tax=Agrilus planipennis TaxID=224129 RepID=A0A1W4X317_AGRPL|nr:nose resistant to fluoxetine protein 6-like [Agrilus planipennis]